MAQHSRVGVFLFFKRKRIVGLSFRQFIYIALLSLLVMFGVKQCSQQVLSPYFSKETVTESRLQYQKSQEARVKQNVDSVLRKLLGKDTFDTSVVMFFKEDYVQQNIVERDPKHATESFSEEINHDFQRLRKEALANRTPIDAVDLLAVDGKLPGMIDLGSSNVVKEAMPGFPVLTEPFKADPDPVTTDTDVAPSLTNDSGKDVMDPNDKGSDSSKRKMEQSKLYFNEKVTQTTKPGNRVERMVVNVIVDQDQIKVLELSKEQLETLISDVASLDRARGDELHVAYLPFVEKSFGLAPFYAKNRKAITVFVAIFDKIWIGILGLILLSIIIGLGYWGYSVFRKKMLERARLAQEEKERRLAQDLAKEKEKKEGVDLRRKAVVSLAQSRPNDVAMLILNWIDAFEGEEKRNAPGT